MRFIRLLVMLGMAISLVGISVVPAAAEGSTSAPVKIDIIPYSVTLTPGASVPLKVSAGSLTLNFKSVVWSSDKPGIVSVDPATGVATAVSVGSAVITCTINGTGKLYRTISVVSSSSTTPTPTPSPTPTPTPTPTSPSITWLSLSPGSSSLFAGSSVSLTANVTPANAAVQIAWTSNNPAVATVNSSGVVNAVAPGTAVVTASGGGKSASSPITVTASTYNPAASSSIVTSHPRLWVTSNDLPRLRSWATPSNPMYANATSPALKQAISTYNTQFFPNGVANPVWPDPGNPFVNGYVTEAYSEFFAYMSLVDPIPGNRATYAGYARNLLMYAIHAVEAGMNNPNDPNWGSFNFPVRDRARWHGEGFALTVDWIYPILTTQDKVDIQKVFLYWANAINTQYQSPIDHGLNGVPDSGPSARNATNNYYTGLFRNLVMMVLALDPADDPPVDPSKDSMAWGNTLRSYMPYIENRWMKQLYAQYGPGGAAEGGAHPEGSYYGLENMGFFRQAILALQTAGYNDPSVSGPYIGITDMPFWDGLVDATIKSTPNNPVTIGPSTYMGQVYQIDNYGDNQHFWLPDASLVQSFGPMGIYDSLKGNTTRLNTDKWMIQSMAPGGTSKFYSHAANIWPNDYASLAIFYFMLFDPSASAPTDPRPGMNTGFFAKGMGRMTDRTSWSSNASLFTFMSGFLSVGHQQGYSGMFSFNRNNEWLTKELTTYASDNKGLASEFHNTLSLKNDDLPASALSTEWWAPEINKRGGQWVYSGYNNGDPKLTTSMQQDYDYAQTDLTNLYNNPYGAKDIAHASRSIVWLKPDIIVIYDRATSGQDGRFKRFNLWLPSNPIITGHTASSLSTSGKQKLAVTSLQPGSGTLTATSAAAEPINSIASDDPMHYKLVIEDPSNPKDIRFLTALEGLDANAAPTQPVGIQSSGGSSAFAGAVMNQTAVLFPVDITKPFISVTYTVPAGVNRQLVTGLNPAGKYDVAEQPVPGGTLVTITPGTGFQADNGGVLDLHN